MTTFVVAHGAWSAGWAWKKMHPLMAARGHKLELDKAVLPFLVRKGFHPKLGARPMRDAVEKLVGDALAVKLLAGQDRGGRLQVDESRDCLVVG